VSVTISNVLVKEVATGSLVEAKLFDDILPNHVDDFRTLWKGNIERLSDEHRHWDWEKKHHAVSTSLSYKSFALEVSGITQGLMIANTTKHCRISSQQNKHLVYIEFLESAPWNTHPQAGATQYKRVGPVLLAAGIQLSLDEGNHGRIGLHSLPQADDFYRDRCGMTDLGSDANKQNLKYFEMTESQASRFMGGGR